MYRARQFSRTNSTECFYSKPEILEINMGAGKSKAVAETRNFDISMLQQLPEDARKQLKNYIETQDTTIAELKEKHEQCRVDSGII